MISSPLYWSGSVYHAGLWLMHGKGIDRRCKYIAGMLDDSVVDVGCGTGILADYLPPGRKYLGIDLNERFLRYAKKKGRNVMLQDALTFDSYSDYDACVIMDLLHHINPRHKEFVERVLSDVRKRVIICEPFEVPDRNPITKSLVRIIDSDGTNSPEEWMDKESLREFYDSFGPKSVVNMGQAMIAVYEKT